MLFDRPGNEGDVIGVRPYRHGDRLRSIHWAQTARRDALTNLSSALGGASGSKVEMLKEVVRELAAQ